MDKKMEKYIAGDRWLGEDIQEGELKIIMEELLAVGNRHHMAEIAFLAMACVLPGLFVQDTPELAGPVLEMLDKTRHLVLERLNSASLPTGN